MDRLYQETMDNFYTIGAGNPNEVSTPNDDAASTSSIADQEFMKVEPHPGPQDQLSQWISRGDFNLQSMVTVRLRRIETMAEETFASHITKLEAHMNGCRNRGISCERWAVTHDAQLSWATTQINEIRRKRDELRRTIEELDDRIVELTTRLNQVAQQMSMIERTCTFHATDIRTQFNRMEEEVRSNASLVTNPVSPTSYNLCSHDRVSSAQPMDVRREGGDAPPCL